MEGGISENSDSHGPGGISRSGRVRRKSSKFADYESAEEIDSFQKKKISPAKQPLKTQKVMVSSSSSSSDSSDSDSSDSDSNLDVKNDSLKYLEEWNENVNPEEVLSLKNDEGDYDYEDHIEVDDYGSHDDSNFNQTQSLYFSEKKKPSLKDSLITRQKKAERKDKGQSRLTAYMLWAKETRPSVIEENPTFDCTAVNRYLGDMWTRVTPQRKMSLKRRAKLILATSTKVTKGKAMISTGKSKKSTSPKTKSGKKGPIQQLYRVVNKNETQSQRRSSTSSKPQAQTPKSVRQSSGATLGDSGSPPSSFKVTGTTPIDVAAHLKLLGESLNNIGQKLKEHEGQIAVSGSLSVLLDSMLCVLGPLACLTNQIDETRGAIAEDTLKGILDNIAYIMPGIF